MNHIMFGEIGAWFFKAPGGIKPDTKEPGFKNVILEPKFMEGLDSFKAEHNGKYGLITSSWVRNAAGLEYNVVIPASSTGSVKLPKTDDKKWYHDGKLVSGSEVKIVSGAYTFINR